MFVTHQPKKDGLLENDLSHSYLKNINICNWYFFYIDS